MQYPNTIQSLRNNHNRPLASAIVRSSINSWCDSNIIVAIPANINMPMLPLRAAYRIRRLSTYTIYAAIGHACRISIVSTARDRCNIAMAQYVFDDGPLTLSVYYCWCDACLDARCLTIDNCWSIPTCPTMAMTHSIRSCHCCLVMVADWCIVCVCVCQCSYRCSRHSCRYHVPASL